MDEHISLGSDDQPFYESNYPIPDSSQSYEQASQSAYGYPYGEGYAGPSVYTPHADVQGSMGVMDQSQTQETSATFGEELPLLEELGINFEHIKDKTLQVLNPLKRADSHIMDDTDVAGPLLFCLLFGCLLLLHGKVHFGYIYGVGLLGCLSLYFILNLMSVGGVSVGVVMSVLGYCLLPMVLLCALSLVLTVQGVIGSVLVTAVIGWCSISASKLFVTSLCMDSQQPLVAYPCALLYGVFALLTVF